MASSFFLGQQALCSCSIGSGFLQQFGYGNNFITLAADIVYYGGQGLRGLFTGVAGMHENDIARVYALVYSLDDYG